MEKTTLLSQIKLVASQLKGCKLKKSHDVEDAIMCIAGALGLRNSDEALVFVVVFARHCEANTTRIRELARYLNCPILAVMEYQKCIVSLIEAGYLLVTDESEIRKFKMCFDIPKALYQDVSNERPITHTECKTRTECNNKLDSSEFIDETHKLVFRCAFKAIDLPTMLTKMGELESQNEYLKVVSSLKNRVEDIASRIVFYIAAHHFLKDKPLRLRDVEDILGCTTYKSLLRLFEDNKSVLQTACLVGVDFERIDSPTMSLRYNGKELMSNKSIDVDLDADIITVEKMSGKPIIEYSDIATKELFFEERIQHQLSTVTRCLDSTHYNRLMARFHEKNLPTGVTVLLYGCPGTGKTESVRQIAKQTQRHIMWVDIASCRSKWYGESEKNVKAIFDDYKSLCAKCRVKPILLFNEADSIFSKRRDSSFENSMTENAIQGILLEEMEKFDGIMIATTNIVNNLDEAFERRFLFKIRFDRPSIESKTKIWLNKMPSLDASCAEQLAINFDFSGGEIDNIVRKATLDEVVYGTEPSYEMLLALSREEKTSQKQCAHVGFRTIY